MRRMLAAWLLGSTLSILAAQPAAACLSDDYKEKGISIACKTDSLSDVIFKTIFGASTKTRQIAVLAGVSEYTNLGKLKSTEYDINELIKTFRDKLNFDEIIVLKNSNFTKSNLEYIFSKYLPRQLIESKNSRVVFAYSGHGSELDGTGYLLLQNAKSLELKKFEDTIDVALSFEVLKAVLLPTINYATQFLALINSCRSGHFATKIALGNEPMGRPVASVITAGGPHDTAFAMGNVGSGQGTVFFELVNAALNEHDIKLAGTMVAPPGKGSGIIQYTQLFSYLDESIQKVLDFKSKPEPGMLLEKNSRDEPEGAFFFVTDRELAAKTLSEKFPKEYKEALGTSSTPAPPAAEPKPPVSPGSTPAVEPPAKLSPPALPNETSTDVEVTKLRAKLASLKPAISTIPLPKNSSGFLAPPPGPSTGFLAPTPAPSQGGWGTFIRKIDGVQRCWVKETLLPDSAAEPARIYVSPRPPDNSSFLLVARSEPTVKNASLAVLKIGKKAFSLTFNEEGNYFSASDESTEKAIVSSMVQYKAAYSLTVTLFNGHQTSFRGSLDNFSLALDQMKSMCGK